MELLGLSGVLSGWRYLSQCIGGGGGVHVPAMLGDVSALKGRPLWSVFAVGVRGARVFF